MLQTVGSAAIDPQTMDLIQKTCKKREHVKLTVGMLADGKKTVRVFDESGETDNNDYVYEIGSITKTFTAMLLSKFVLENRMSLDDSIAEYVPGLKDGQYYPTLRRLATHTAGYSAYYPLGKREVLKLFIDMAFGLNQGVIPFELDRAALQASVQRKALLNKDYKWAYSNYGFALIGYAIGVVSNQGYWSTMNGFLSKELGLKNTYLGICEGRNLHGYSTRNKDCGNWDCDEHNLFSPAGCMSSSADDLLSYAKLNIFEEKPYIPLCHEKHADGGKKKDMGLAWFLGKDDNSIMYHEGGTGAFSSFLVFDKTRELASVVLANHRLGITSDRDIGLSVLKNLQRNYA